RPAPPLGPHLHVRRPRPLAGPELRVVLGLELLELRRLEEPPERRLVLELVQRHVLMLVLAENRPVAPGAHRALVLQELRAVLLVVPPVEGGLLVFEIVAFTINSTVAMSGLLRTGVGVARGAVRPPSIAPSVAQRNS